jgi:IclR family pca regulon transcriptional regulator
VNRTKGKATERKQWRHLQATDSDQSQSFSHSLAILTCFSPGAPVLSVADVADEVGISEVTTRRCIVRLVALGYLGPETSERHRFTARMIHPELMVLPTVLHEYSHSCLVELRWRTSYTVSLAILEGSEIVYMDRARSFRRGQHRIDSNICIGSRQPAYATAMGKILMAYTPDPDRQQLVRELTLTKQGPCTVESKSALRSELEQVRKDGMAVNREELAEGLIAIAVPVRGFYRDVVASVGMSAHTSMTSLEEMISGLFPQLQATADRISARLGYRRNDETRK